MMNKITTKVIFLCLCVTASFKMRILVMAVQHTYAFTYARLGARPACDFL